MSRRKRLMKRARKLKSKNDKKRKRSNNLEEEDTSFENNFEDEELEKEGLYSRRLGVLATPEH